jgi:hypothetical protein
MHGGFSLTLFYSLLDKASKNLQTFQELSTNFPQTFQEQFIYSYHTRSTTAQVTIETISQREQIGNAARK